MKFDSYFNKLPEGLGIKAGATNEVKLAYLFGFYEYFNGDEENIDDFKEGFFGGRDNNFLDGVYLNTSLDEDRIDLYTTYFVGDNGIFNKQEAFEAVRNLVGNIQNALAGSFTYSRNTVEFLKKRIENYDVDKYCVRLVTDYVPSDEERNALKRKLSDQFDDEENIKVEIVFGDDIIQIVQENTYPFEYVNVGEFKLDKPNNILRYDDNSFVCNISAKSLKALWKSDGRRGLLAMNLRYYISNDAIDNKIENSIVEHPEDFWYYNNGIIIVCDNYQIIGDTLRMEKFSIVNGGQTTRMIGEVIFDKDFYLVCKVVKSKFEDQREKNAFIANVAEASNTQKPIKAKDLIANRVEQRNLKSLLADNGIFIEIKRGDTCPKDKYPEQYQRTKNNELAQDLFSFVYLQPGSARNNLTKILQQQDKYDKIFVKDEYSIGFLKDIIWLDKIYNDYKKAMKKDPNINEIKSGLVLNGKCFALATIGFILKNIYNKEYYTNCKIYKNNQAFRDIYYNDQAFNHGFIKENDYKECKKRIFEVFDYVFDSFISETFKVEKQVSPNIAYSNFLKRDSNFKKVIARIETYTWQYDNSVYKTIQDFFKSISDVQENKNEALYATNVQNAIKQKNKYKPSEGEIEKNKDLNLKLETFRMEKAKEYKVSENKIYTDKQIEKLVLYKPKNSYEFQKYCKTQFGKYFMKEILAIIAEFLD